MKSDTTMSESQLSDALHRLVHAYKSHLRSEVAKQNLNLPITHFRALKGIARNPSSTALSLARRMQRDKAQITRVLKELQEDGLIEKRPNPEDGRSQLLLPTRKGQNVIARLLEAEQHTAQTMTRSLNARDVQRFTELTAHMVANLDEPTDREN